MTDAPALLRLFYEKPRSNFRRRRRGESFYDFYDAAAGEPFITFRTILNEWADQLPDGERQDLIQRIQASAKEGGIPGGFFHRLAELVTHRALRQCGYSVQVHPPMSGTTTRPDFLALGHDGLPVAYVEVTTLNMSGTEVSRERREAVIFDRLNQLRIDPDLRIRFLVQVCGQKSPAISKFVRDIEAWARQHAAAARTSAWVEQNFSHDGWQLGIRLYGGYAPESDPDRIVVAVPGRHWPGREEMAALLQQKLLEKASRYGIMNIPYVIVVVDLTEMLGSMFTPTVAEALFGTLPAGNWTWQNWLGKPVPRSNGFWHHLGTPLRQNVSAVVVFPDHLLWRLGEHGRQPVITHNPWAAHPLPRDALPFFELTVDGLDVGVQPRRTAAEIVGLPHPWPGMSVSSDEDT